MDLINLPFKLPSNVSLYLLLMGAFIYLFLSMLLRYFIRIGHPAAKSIREVRNILLPGVLLLLSLTSVFRLASEAKIFKVAETVFWFTVIWVSPSLVKALFYTRSENNVWRTNVPELFLDILRFAFVAIGAALVFAGVWGRDLGGFFATLGVGSIVLGLALQETLGNLMAGIALLFERPFSVGHWIRVGDTEGTVHEMNWRSVHLHTRAHDLVIVPNSVLGKERIQNFSRPTTAHVVELYVGLSYDDPPNKVKRVLLRIAKSTRGVLPEGILIRTVGYLDFSVNYQVRFFIDDYERLPDIQEEYLTQVWYAVRRNKLTIPFPIRTVQKTEVPFTPAADTIDEVRIALKAIAILSPLSEEEIDSLARDAIIQEFARGERIVYQGDDGDTLYVIRSGVASVALTDASTGERRELARLQQGQFFGEMALLTGEARTANVDAIEDLEVIAIYKSAMEPILRARPELARAIAGVVEARQDFLNEVKEEQLANVSETSSKSSSNSEILQMIKRFFSIAD